MQPLFDNLNVIKGQLPAGGSDVRRIDDMQINNQLVIEALAFIRGRCLSETFCIVDESQNLTPQEIKTIITRAGEGTKMVFTGEIQQIDSPYLDSQSNGLAYMVDKMKGQDLFAHINLIKGERSQLSELASDLLLSFGQVDEGIFVRLICQIKPSSTCRLINFFSISVLLMFGKCKLLYKWTEKKE